MQVHIHLQKSREKLLKRWEEISVAKLPEAQKLSHAAIRDHMPQVFAGLCQALETRVLKKQDSSKTHGRERSNKTNYSLAEVMAEYSILKNLIYDDLTSEGALTLEDIRIIDRFFDLASSTATIEFVELREYELNSVTDALVVMNQDLDTFAAIAAHDLRSPASTILGFASLLADEEAPAKDVALRAVTTIQKTASRMLELIDQLLDYAKVGKDHLNRERFSLKDAAHEAIDNLSTQIQDTGAKILVGDLPAYNGDQILFRQVFQNLISNSIKFRAKERPCEVNISSLEEKDGGIRLTVKDNCGGFDPNLCEVIFQPFKRGDRSDTHGSGLGLATVRKIVELHGGKISASSQLNCGAEFTVQLPSSNT